MQTTTDMLNFRVDSDFSAATELSLDDLDGVNGGFLVPVLIAAALIAGFIAGSEMCTC